MRPIDEELHYRRFLELHETLRHMLEQPFETRLLDVCEASFQHIEPALRYFRRRNPDSSMFQLLPFDVVRRYGPPLFADSILRKMQRLIESSDFLREDQFGFGPLLDDLQTRQELARRIWNRVEAEPGVFQRVVTRELRAPAGIVGEIVTVWENLGLMLRPAQGNTHRLIIHATPEEETLAECPACGQRLRAIRRAFYSERECRRCGESAYFHLLGADASTMA